MRVRAVVVSASPGIELMVFLLWLVSGRIYSYTPVPAVSLTETD
jgi:hypothetical protein